MPLTDEDAIEDVKASEEVTETARYDLGGRKQTAPQRGINIIRYSDGTTVKVKNPLSLGRLVRFTTLRPRRCRIRGSWHRREAAGRRCGHQYLLRLQGCCR